MKKILGLVAALLVLASVVIAISWRFQSSATQSGTAVNQAVPNANTVTPVTNRPTNTETNPTTTNTNETFLPPTGAGDHEGTEGPWARRILGAYSDDGLTWTKTNEVITDQADVPSLVSNDDGQLFMYYYGWTIGDKQNAPAVATSDDEGTTWAFHSLNFSGYPGRGDVSDPDVVFVDGKFRMYGTTRDGGHAHILWGESTDGFNFTYGGVAFDPDDGNAGVASVYQAGDDWRLLSLASLGVTGDVPVEAGQHWYATSTDGKTFTFNKTVSFPVDGRYEHYKGNYYEVLGVAQHSETREELVVYRALYGEYGLWVRPLTMFLENVTVEGKIVPRFKYLKEE